MSVENEKVCCNCKYRRNRDNDNKIYCWCNFTGRYLSYAEIMTGWCRHWSKESEDIDENRNNNT